ncbi:hypothetical protein M9H77_18177 [Catharanthus roseus]|uniref:Uncharacterized protein n=1 Tax=Catharanthus roseus TaxID=4058 RepID=A0ACC0B6P9_CATRO|nr:hypothetical protein M9H77_18177 [Catharanthus roseus]
MSLALGQVRKKIVVGKKSVGKSKAKVRLYAKVEEFFEGEQFNHLDYEKSDNDEDAWKGIFEDDFLQFERNVRKVMKGLMMDNLAFGKEEEEIFVEC